MRFHPLPGLLRGLLTGVALALPLACSIPDRFTGSLGPSDAGGDATTPQDAGKDTGLSGPSDAGGDITAPQDAGTDTGLPGPSDAGGDVTTEAATPSFALQVGVTRVSVVRGASARIPVTIVPAGGFAGAVSVSVSKLPAGVTAGPLLLASGATTGQLTLDAAASAPLSVSGVLETTATSGSLVAPSASLPIIVQDPPGTLDVTFGSGGVATLTIPAAAAPSGLGRRGLTVQPDGKVAFTGVVDNYTLLVGRVTADGKADTSFATNGFFTSNALEFGAEVGGTILALPSGGLVCAGFAFVTAGGNHAMFIAKFRDNGTLDPSFASGRGLMAIGDGTTDSKAFDLALQPDGKLVLSGYAYGYAALVRLTPEGLADPTFDPAPTGTNTIGVNTYPEAGAPTALALLPSGDLLAQTPSTSFIGYRFTSVAAFDPTYGDGGTASAAVPGQLAGGTFGGLVVQPGGLAIHVGSATSTIEAVRFDANGAVDGTFGTSGRISMPIPGSSTVVVDGVALMSDARFVVSTHFTGTKPIGVVRYTAAGKLDTTFAGVGYVGVAGSAAGGQEPIAVDAADRIYVATILGGTVNIFRFWP